MNGFDEAKFQEVFKGVDKERAARHYTGLLEELHGQQLETLINVWEAGRERNASLTAEQVVIAVEATRSETMGDDVISAFEDHVKLAVFAGSQK